MRIKKNLTGVLILAAALFGLLDSLYLSYMHFMGIVPPCEVGSIFDCGQVLFSEYAYLAGIPLAYIGVAHYALVLSLAIAYVRTQTRTFLRLLAIMTSIGAGMSVYFTYIQVGVMQSLCLYCLISAVISWILLPLVLFHVKMHMNHEH